MSHPDPDQASFLRKAVEAGAFRAELRTRLRQFLAPCFELMQGDEGSLWLRSGDELVLALNTGKRATELEWRVRIPVAEGVTSAAFRTQSVQTDKEAFHGKDFNHLVDEKLGQHTFNVSAAPLVVLAECVGALSVVQVGRPSEPVRRRVWGFPDALETLWTIAGAGAAAILECEMRRSS